MEKFQKIVSLIEKTGEKIIILGQNSEPDLVIMSLADYEDLILGKNEPKRLTEDEFLDKINRDIEKLNISEKNSARSEDSSEFSENFDVFNLAPQDMEDGDEDSPIYFEPVEN